METPAQCKDRTCNLTGSMSEAIGWIKSGFLTSPMEQKRHVMLRNAGALLLQADCCHGKTHSVRCRCSSFSSCGSHAGSCSKLQERRVNSWSTNATVCQGFIPAVDITSAKVLHCSPRLSARTVNLHRLEKAGCSSKPVKCFIERKRSCVQAMTCKAGEQGLLQG